MATQQLRRPPGSSGLYDVLELILDRGLVIDAYARVSVVGIELLTVDLRVVVASVDTYIRYAEAIERLGWHERASSVGLPEVVSGATSMSTTRRAVHRGSQQVADAVGVGDGGSQEQGHHGGVTGALARGAEKLKDSLSGSEDGDEDRAEQRRNGESQASSDSEESEDRGQHEAENGGEHQ